MMFTVLGASGFIGRNLVQHLEKLGHEVFAPPRNHVDILSRPLGHVVYCIGLTADFRQRPFDTVGAHVSVLATVLEHASFDSFLYLSSTRVYAKSTDTRETAVLPVDSSDPSDLYNLSKLMGESLCLNCGRLGARVVRLSNVVGFDPLSSNFLASLIREALSGRIRLRSALASAKDYIAVEDVLELLPRIAMGGKAFIYNVASGANIANHVFVERLSELTNCIVDVVDAAPLIAFPVIDITRLRDEFAPRFTDPRLAIRKWVDAQRQGFKAK